MSTSTDITPTPEKSPQMPRLTASRVGERLPDWFSPVLLALSIMAGAIITIGMGGLNVLGAVAFGAVIYVAVLYVVAVVKEGERWAADRLAGALVTSAFVIVMIPLISLISMVVVDGIARFNWEFLSTDMVGVYGETEAGGALHAIVGTLWVTGIASLIAIPLGIFTAVYLVEYPGSPGQKLITFLVDVMTGIPSIVAGLFAFSLFFSLVSPGYKSALIGAVALAVLMTPVVVRGTEEMLKLVPNELREASYALGVPKWLTIVKVVLRTAIAGITTSVMIAIARVIGETAPLLVTVGIVPHLNLNPLDERMTTLPVFVFRQYAQGGESNMQRAWAGALTLILIVMILNLGARLVSHFFSPKGQSR